MSKLPILLSIPHSGTVIPQELESRLCIMEQDLFDDRDPFADKIYDVRDKVEKVVSTHIPRTFVDLNRSLQEMPPENPDGIIKSTTCHQKPIYMRGKEPDERLQKILIDRYYMPYHREIQRAIMQLDLQLCLDCHSMAAVAPTISPDDTGEKRPSFCISNQDGKTSSEEMMELLASCISKSFSVSMDQIGLNVPFKGGHIVKTYGMMPVPWIQVEINRDMYLSERWFDADSQSFRDSRLQQLNSMFELTLESFFKRI